MEIYLVRHGIAEDPMEASIYGRGDPERHLTDEGIERTRRVAIAFHKRAESMNLILHSPYVRARETAEIFAKEYKEARLEQREDFRPHDKPSRGSELLGSLAGHRRVMVVSHDPYISHLASYLLSGRETLALTFKKATIAGFEWGGPGACRLLFLLPPKMLLG